MRALIVMLLVLIGASCGGKAVIDPETSGPAGGAGGTGAAETSGTGGTPETVPCPGMQCGAPCVVNPEKPEALGECTEDGFCLFEAICQPPDPCLQLPTCSPCEACTIHECFQGFCDARRNCNPEHRCP